MKRSLFALAVLFCLCPFLAVHGQNPTENKLSKLREDLEIKQRKESMTCRYEQRKDGIIYRVENHYRDNKLIMSMAVPFDTLIKKSNVQVSGTSSETAAKTGTTGGFEILNAVDAQDSLALVAFYNATGGDSWTTRDNWLTGPVNTWYGVTVIDDKVTDIWLSYNNLTGNLPPEIGDLVNLQNLYLWGNNLTGTLPAPIGNLTRLTYLNIGNCGLTGPLPEELFTLTNLQSLTLYDMNLTGTLQTGFANLINLQRLELSGNQLSGTFPAELLTMTQLESLYLDGNGFSGTIPASIGNLTNLQNLGLNYCGLTGPLPAELFSLVGLRDLGLSDFHLSGIIPPELGNLTGLNFLNLSNNQFESIPAELYTLSALSGLYLFNNNFSGPVPDEIFTLTNLSGLGLGENKFSGAFPAAVNNLTNLGYLNISNNDLTDFPVITGLTNLWGVNAENNYLTFKDIEPNIGVPSSFFYYAPQADIGKEQSVQLNIGDNYNLNVTCGGIHNRYQWFKNWVAISGAETPDYQVIVNAAEDAGDYTCHVTNTVATDLTIYSRPVHISVYDPAIVTDSLALVALYNATGGENWTNHNNWLTGTLNTWYGVGLGGGRVVSLNLGYNNLTGSLPAEIGNLIKLQSVYLSGNNLSGTLPAAIGSLTQLQNLELSNSGLTGPLPEELFTLTGLQYLYLYSMNLTGSIPSGITNLVNLNWLDLSGNHLSGAFPAELLNMTQLTGLSLSGNQFSGTIPASIGNLVNLQRFVLNYCGLTGPLPAELFSLANLLHLGLSDFGLSGIIPPEIANLAELNFLDLSGNQFDSISAELYTLSNLRYLNLSYNNFSGPVPQEIFTLTNLYLLELADNKLSGAFPAAVNNLTNLNYLFILNNDLTEIPALTGLTNLRGVYAENNYFTFEDIEPNLGLASGNFNYSPQKETGETRRFDFLEGSDYNFQVDVGGSSNNYQWYKDYALIEGATGSTHNIVSAIPANMGRYHCEVTSNIVPNLTILSKPIFLSNPVNPADSLALVALYNSTGGDSWYNKNGWLTSPVDEWYGIVLEGGRVVSLNLGFNNLSGSLPVETGNLTALRNLFLYGNQLSGAVPTEINNLANLQNIDIWNNLFEDLPVMTGLTSLQYAYMNDNQFTFEDIEPNLGIASGYFSYSPQKETGELQVFPYSAGASYSFDATVGGSSNHYQWTQNNSIVDGAIAAIYQIDNADESDRGNYTCQITSDIVPNLIIQTKPFILPYPINTSDSLALVALYNSTAGSSWTRNDGWLSQPLLAWYGVSFEGDRVTSVQLQNNNLNGSIPAETGSLTGLWQLDLSGNNLTGGLPTTIGNLTNLSMLHLQYNSLSGGFPLIVTNLPNLTSLDLGGNLLTGSIPVEIGNLSNLQRLHLGGNQFSGNLPAEIGNLTSLGYLSLWNDNLTGPLPAEIGNLTNLYFLDLRQNDFSGEIPSEIGNLINLNQLNLTGNLFNGDVPSSINNLINLYELNLNENELTGLPELTGIVNLNWLYVENNRLTFDDLEYNMDEVTYGFYYTPQANTGTVLAIDVPERSYYTISAGTGGVFSQYRWMKDGETIPGATLSSYILGPVIASDAGVYTCEITNTLVTGLTLYLNPVQVTVVPAAEHFIPAWYGHGIDPMNFYILSATVNGLELLPGDEIAIFDDTVCVGAGVLADTLNGSDFLNIVVSRDNETTTGIDGYTAGNRAVFRLWDTVTQQEYTLVDTAYTQGDGIFEAGGTAVVSLAVTTVSDQVITLAQGWNIFSLAVQPDSINMKAIVQPLIDAGILIKVQNEAGLAIENAFPIGWINGIGNWSFAEGYKIKVNQATQLTVTGLPIPLPAGIDLAAGWNIFGYPLLTAQDAQDAVSTLITNGTLIKVQDEAGFAIEYVIPMGWVDNIFNFQSGEGYKIKVTANEVLILDEPGTLKSTLSDRAESPEPVHFKTVWTGNGLDHMNLYLVSVTINGKSLSPGDEVALYDGDLCVGAMVIEPGNNAHIMVAASNDDPETDEADGFLSGNPIRIKIWSAANSSEFTVDKPAFTTGSIESFEPMGTTVASVSYTASELPGSEMPVTGLGDNYPNPFSTETIIPYTIGKGTKVTIELYNLLGDRIKTIVSKYMPAGSYRVIWDKTDNNRNSIQPGIYFIKMIADDQIYIKSMEVIR